MNKNKKEQLKQKLSSLLNEVKEEEYDEIFLQTINEVFVEKWLEDRDEELFMVNLFSSVLINSLRDKILEEIGEKYANTVSKLSFLVSNFIMEITEKETSNKIKEIKNKQDVLKSTKELVEELDEENGENW